MFQKYNDTPAAICLGIYLLGCIFYVFQLLFMTETWLERKSVEKLSLLPEFWALPTWDSLLA